MVTLTLCFGSALNLNLNLNLNTDFDRLFLVGACVEPPDEGLSARWSQ